MGFEPTTPCLEGRNSTAELLPQTVAILYLNPSYVKIQNAQLKSVIATVKIYFDLVLVLPNCPLSHESHFLMPTPVVQDTSITSTFGLSPLTALV